MDIKFLTSKKIESDPKISKNSYTSAKRMYEDVKVDYVTSKHIGFTSVDKNYGTMHSVIYFSEKKFPDSWNCDCHWFTLKRIYCKHILSVFVRLEKDEVFLKKFKKTKL